MLVSPVPSVLQEFLTAQVVLLDALLSQTLHHLSLGSDRCVVGTRHPACVLAFHTCTAHKDILNSVVEHVSHVQHTCYVWWRYYYSVWFSTVWLAAEKFVVKPVLIPFRLHSLWVVFAC